MRVIAGQLGGRTFKSPPGHTTHPMSEKMRGAIFNSLGDISGMSVLVAFAGSGALGFEARSRGAGQVIMIERDRTAQNTISENMVELGIGGSVHLMRANTKSWLKTRPDMFDIILLDPPYDKLQYDLIEMMGTRLHKNGRLVLSWPGKREPAKIQGCELVRQKQYGDSSLHFYDSISL